MRDRTEKTARHFGIFENLEKLEKYLLEIPRVVSVDFDVDNYDELHQVCILIGYDIPVTLNDYFTFRGWQIGVISNLCENMNLYPSGDRVEDYGEHWYFVRNCGRSWIK